MLNQQTMEKLHALRLTGMAEAYRRQMEDAEMAGLSFEERFGLMVDQHWTWRENQAMARRLKKSRLDAEPCVEDINFRHPRGLDRALMRTLSTSQWVSREVELFRALHPEVSISLNLSDRVVDLAGEGFDCAVRVGDLPDSSLVSVRMADNRRLCVATPQYLQRHGVPEHPNSTP